MSFYGLARAPEIVEVERLQVYRGSSGYDYETMVGFVAVRLTKISQHFGSSAGFNYHVILMKNTATQPSLDFFL